MGHRAMDARKGMTPMRRTMIVVLSVAVLSCAVTLGGCVSAAEYSRLQAANRRTNEIVDQQGSDLRGKFAEIAGLRAEMQRRQDELAIRTTEARDAKGAYDDMKSEFDKLKVLYDAEMARDGAPMMGPLPAKVHAALRTLAAANPDLMEYLPKYGMVKMKSDLSFGLGPPALMRRSNSRLVMTFGNRW